MTRAAAALLLALPACLPDYRFDLTDAGATGGSGGGGPTAPWWDESFSRRIRLTVDTSVVSEDLADVPVLVVPTPARIDYALTQPDGRDLRFVADDGFTVLPHEVDRWDPAGASHVWVKLPTLSPAPSTATLWLYWGNPGATEAQQPAEVWSEYVAVYHFNDDLGGGSTVRDATGSGHDGEAQQLAPANVVSGAIGRAFDFVGGAPGPSVVVAEPASADFDVPDFNARVLEVWARRTSVVATGGGIAGKEACCLGWGLALLTDDFVNVRSAFASGPCCPPDGCCPNPSYAYVTQALPQLSGDNDWHMFTSSMDRGMGRMVLYIDGVSDDMRFTSIPQEGTAANAPFFMGADALGSSSFPGLVDELRIGAHVFPPSWALVQTRSGNDELLTYGAMEQVPAQ